MEKETSYNEKALVIKGWKKFDLSGYKQSFNPHIELGTLVRYPKDENRIGVVIQLHDDGDFRTDMNGNTSMSEIEFATVEDVKLYRPKLIPELDKQALIDLTLLLIKTDIDNDDVTAIEAMLSFIPKKNLLGYVDIM